MFAIIDTHTGAVVDTVRGTWHAAERLAHYLTATTKRLHIVREMAR